MCVQPWRGGGGERTYLFEQNEHADVSSEEDENERGQDACRGAVRARGRISKSGRRTEERQRNMVYPAATGRHNPAVRSKRQGGEREEEWRESAMVVEGEAGRGWPRVLRARGASWKKKGEGGSEERRGTSESAYAASTMRKRVRQLLAAHGQACFGGRVLVCGSAGGAEAGEASRDRRERGRGAIMRGRA